MSEHSRDGRRLADNPIAIVGVSGLFPMARNLPRATGSNIVDGADCIEDVPESRWNGWTTTTTPTRPPPDKTYSRRGGFLPEVDFNPLEFGAPAEPAWRSPTPADC